MLSWVNLTTKLEDFRLVVAKDTLCWSLDNCGYFLTRSLFFRLVLVRQSLSCFLSKLIWEFKVPKKVKILFWLLAHKSLNTHDRMQRRNPSLVLVPTVCLLCWCSQETLDHLFLFCPFASHVWCKLLASFDVPILSLERLMIGY